MLAFRSILIALLTSVLNSMAKEIGFRSSIVAVYPLLGDFQARSGASAGGGLMFVSPHGLSFTDTILSGGPQSGWALLIPS
jgi:hypothetical protein